jgi:hypothetical protein
MTPLPELKRDGKSKFAFENGGVKAEVEEMDTTTIWTGKRVIRHFSHAGTATAVVELRHYLSDHLPFIALDLTWEGQRDLPEKWSIRWSDHVTSLANDLPDYLRTACPGRTKRIMAVVYAALPSEVRNYFTAEKGWVLAPEKQGTEEPEGEVNEH